MNQNSIQKDIETIIAEILDIEDFTLRAGLVAQMVPGYDSLNHIRILASLEEKFKIRFTLSEIENLESIDRLVGLVCSKLKK